jgi:hypothetical protein
MLCISFCSYTKYYFNLHGSLQQGVLKGLCGDNFHNGLEEYGVHLALIKKLRLNLIIVVAV